jgi:L-ascorbate metabolism protein UlaG (beta-lactamase superfamily)
MRIASPSSRKRRWPFAVAAIVVGVFAMAASSTRWFATLGGRLEGARLERARRSPHFDGKKFVNAVPTNVLVPGTTWEMIRHQLFGREERVPSRPPPVVSRGTGDFATPPASGLRATWIGHASVLVEIDGHRLLTDPIWSERASPSTLVGPRRFHPPPLPLDALPPIDVVIVSHDHFDHLDMATVQALASRGARFAVPLGVGAHLEAWSIPAAQISELDWGESVRVGALELTATPARHYSGRNPLRRDETLWSSWVVKGPRHRLFFSGDSGFSDAFEAIGAARGPFDLTLVKIGACDRTWQDIHMSPEEAVRAHVALGGKLLLPIHWGTFNLAFHAWNAPAEEVLAAATARGVAIAIPRPGEWVEPSAPPPVEAWWR